MRTVTLLKKSLSVILTMAILLSAVGISTAYIANAQSEVELNLTVGCYDSRENSKLSTGTTVAKKYVATQIFTKEDLPNGTQIIVDSGYKYRPEGWVSLDQISSPRPSNVTGASTVTINDAWWGDFNYRAFNISKTTETDMTGKESEVASHFRIVLPEVSEEDDETIKILAIGNSFSNDALHYAEQIAEAFGYKTEFLSLYYSGCSIESHLGYYQSEGAVYDIYRNGSKVRTGVSMKEVLDETEYDYITFQQKSSLSPTYSSYYTESNPHLLNLYNAVKVHQPNAKYLIHQTWSYYSEKAASDFGTKYSDSADMFASIESSYDKAAALLGGLPIIKSGKAVEIAKNSGYLTDDKGQANSMYADSMAHLSDKGDFLTGLVWVETIFGVDVTTKDFTSLFADANYYAVAAHKAVNGEDSVDTVKVAFKVDEEEVAEYDIPRGESLLEAAKDLQIPDKDGFNTKKWEYDGEELDWDMWFTEDAVIEAVYSNVDPEPTKMAVLTSATPAIKADGSSYSSNGERGVGLKLDSTKFVAGEKYVVSLKYHTVNRALGGYYGVSFTLFGNKTNTSSTFLFSNAGVGSRGTQFSEFSADGMNATMSFTMPDISTYTSGIYFGAYFEPQTFTASALANVASTGYLYIADLKIYKEGEPEVNLVSDDFSDVTWKRYGSSTTLTGVASVVDYDKNVFKDSNKSIYRIRQNSTGEGASLLKLNGVKLKGNTEYTISFNHHSNARKIGTGDSDDARFVLTGVPSGKTSAKIIRGRKPEGDYFDVVSNEETAKTYTFTLTEEEAANYTSYQVGFYFEKHSTTTTYSYIGNLALYESEDPQKTNLIPNDKRYKNWRLLSNEDKKTADIHTYEWGSGDSNLDGDKDIRDLVFVEEKIAHSSTRISAATDYNCDVNHDMVFGDADIEFLRKTLLGVLDQSFEGQKKSTHSSTKTVNLGDKVTYKIKVKNITDETRNAKVVDILPESVEFVSGYGIVSGNKFIWSGDVEAGKSKTITYTVKVKDDASYSGSVIGGSNATVNGYNIEGEDIYIVRTIGQEDQRYISNAIRALRDSTYRDLDLVNRIYNVAFSMGVTSYFGATAEETLNSLLAGSAADKTIAAVAPSLYGGKSVTEEIEGIKGTPNKPFTEDSLIVGDVLLVKNGDQVNNYIYDNGGLVDLSNPMNEANQEYAVNTAEILEGLAESDIYAVIRITLHLSRDYVNDDELEELELTPQQEAVIATAESYLLRGEKLQYADKTFGDSSSTEYRWTPNKYAPRNPEYTSRDEWGYTNCAGFTYEVYQTALGINISNNGGTAINQTARWETYAEGRGMVAYKWPENANTLSEEEQAKAKQEFLEVLQPGDLFLLRRASGSGHIMLYIGNGSFIHSSGSVYNFDEYKEVYEPSVRYHRVEDYFFTPSSTTNYLFGDNIGVFWVCRPLARADYNVEVPQQTINRINNMEGIVAQKLSSHNSGETANRGEEITYTFEVYNAGNTAKTVDICDSVPANTTYVSGAQTKNGDNLSWSVTVPANKRVSVSYTVRVNDDVAYGTAIQTTTTSTVGGVNTICPKVYVNNALTADEQNSVANAISTLKTNGTANTKFALVNEIYKTAGLTTEDIFDTDFLTVLEGENGTFKPATKSDGTAVSGFYSLNDTGNKYRDLLVPTLYGGKKIYQQDRERRTDRSRLVRPHHLMTGDILIRRDSTSNEKYYQVFIFDGTKLINLTSGIDDDTITIQKRMEYAMGSAYYYAVYRPSYELLDSSDKPIYEVKNLNAADQTKFVKALQAMRNSKFKSHELIKFLYRVAFSITPIITDDAGTVVNKVFVDTSAEKASDYISITVPGMFGGKEFTTEMDRNLPGEQKTQIKVSDIIPGDIICTLENANDLTSGRFYTTDGTNLYDLNDTCEMLSDTSVLDNIAQNDLYVVLRPSSGITTLTKSINTNEIPEGETDFEKAIIATAESYMLRGERLQYADRPLVQTDPKIYRWERYKTPEDCTSDETGYANCTAFMHNVYYSVTGESYGDFKLADAPNSMKAYTYKFTHTETDEERQQIEEEYKSQLKIGDIIFYTYSGNTHAMLYVGNGNMIHCTGGVYSEVTGFKEEEEASIRYMQLDELFNPNNSSRYLFQTAKPRTALYIIRPSNILGTDITDETRQRIGVMKDVFAEKTSSSTLGQTVNPGDEIIYTFTVFNTKSEAVTLDITDTVPVNTVLIENGVESDKTTLNWTVVVAPNEIKKISYTVKVLDSAQDGDAIVCSNDSKVGGISTKVYPVYVGRTLTEQEQEDLRNIVYSKANYSDNSIDFANAIYEDLFGVENILGSDKAALKSGLFLPSGDYTTIATEGNYAKMIAPTLFGGEQVLNSERWQGERTRLPREHNLIPGDILYLEWKSSYGLYIYMGNGEILNLNKGIEKRDIVDRLSNTIGCQYFAVLRPSLALQ